ncbi:MAG: HEAT repeat domain-containing protein [Dehalococcoidales bacterium]|nr:MAG: HEAT repeat domain-containing protein [Dehalococcoidales bacterium]
MDSSLSEPTGKVIHELAKGEEIPDNTTLAELSGLSLVEMKPFREVWDGLNTERRIQIVNRLSELAEENLELNFDAIFRYCLSDPEENIRCTAIEGLWENEDTSLIDPLIKLLEEDESDKVQSTAAIALGKYAVLAELGKLRSENTEKIREALLGAIDDRNKSIEVIRRVLESAAPLSMPDVQEAISDAYNSNDPGLKISAIYSMGKSCDTSWLPVILKETENDDPEIRHEAAGACGELEDERYVPALIKLANGDDDIDVQMAAIQSLGKIGSLSARECLKLCLESHNDAVKEAAEEALQNIDSSDNPLSFRL